MLFDLDDSLINRRVVFEQWSGEFAAGFPDKPDLMPLLIAADRGGFAPRHEYFSLIRERLRLEDSVEDLLMQWQDSFAKRYALDAEVKRALDHVRTTAWRLGVVTNGSAAMQAAKVEAAGLGAIVDCVVIS
jgi:5'-nucleotidase